MQVDYTATKVVLDDEKSPINETLDTEYGSATVETTESLEEDGFPAERRYLKTHNSFWEDAINFQEGTIPQSVVLAVVIGIVCGISAYAYYFVLEFFLDFLWKTIPEKFIVDVWPEWAYVLWIPLLGYTLCIALGLSVVFLGDPGDLPYTVKCVHEKGPCLFVRVALFRKAAPYSHVPATGYIAMSHVLPMVVASLFSILGGGSLGPEAPLVAICAALGGFVSRRVFGQTNRNIVRKHTLMGMAVSLLLVLCVFEEMFFMMHRISMPL